jgi:L,D-transpeptidase YcbB
MPSSSLRVLLVLSVVLPVACGGRSRPAGTDGRPTAAQAPAADRTAELLKADLASGQPPAYAAADPRAAEDWNAVRALYAGNGYKPVWIAGGKPRPQIAALQAAVQRAAEDGLDPADYDVRPASTLLGARKDALEGKEGAEPILDADVRLSFTLVKLASQLEQGRILPAKVDEHWVGMTRQDDLVKVLRASLDSGTVAESLDHLKPQHPQYAALKKLLARYREAAAHGGWAAIPAGTNLRPGRPDPQVAVLRTHLAATGDLASTAALTASAPAAAAPAAAPQAAAVPVKTSPGAAATTASAPAVPSGPVFDAETQEALKRFERRHGLVADGRLGKDVLAALNVPVEERIRQIELNLERWRWMPESLGDRYILVNIPTFHLTAVDHGQPALEMRVVTGKQDSPTPIFSDEMTTVVFSPFWNIPPDIAKKETIPSLVRDPGYLEKNNLEVVRGSQVLDPWSIDWNNPGRIQFRQRPGAHNALGQVKFLFPNQFDVYLHDTPADALFARVERDYSHGCVRVEKPYELAQWVLQDRPEWTPERIKAAMDAGKEQQVALKRHIPVYIVYETVWVEDDGTVDFRDDIYGHDARQEQLIPRAGAPAVQVAANAPAGAPAGRAPAAKVADAR